MFYTAYKITNKVNGRFYIGAHKTEDLNDGYMGSGAAIRRAIEKHGKENFVKEILHTFDSAEEMFDRERILLEGVWSSSDCYNLNGGGTGATEHLNSDDRHREARARGGQKAMAALHKSGRCNPPWFKGDERVKKAAKKGANRVAELWRDEEWANNTRRNMSAAALANNNMRGRIWITLGDTRKVISVDDWPSYELQGWSSPKKLEEAHVAKMKKRWINNDTENRLIDASDYDHMLQSGWKPGRIKNS